MHDFSGKTVIITGAAGGIGSALCRLFAEAGARLGLLDKSPALRDIDLGSAVVAHAEIVDLTDAELTSTALTRLREQIGPAQVLINNAGYSSAPSLAKTTPESWATDLAINLSGTYHVTRCVLPDMIAGGGGSIVTIGSVNGLQSLGDPAYSAAKAGLLSYTRSLALEYGTHNVRANVICPGTVKTPIWQQRIDRDPQIFERLSRWYPLGRVADPDDVAKAALFLASEDARCITGAALPVDCGLTAGNLVMTRELTLEP